MEKIKLIATCGMEYTVKEVNKYLHDVNEPYSNSAIMNAELIRFGNGEGKCVIHDDVSKNDNIYIFCDPGNYSSSYMLRKETHYFGPDEHIQDLKRIISALSGKAKSIRVVMPMMYQSRQDKRIQQESLDCAMFLAEMHWYGVDEIITFSLHNGGVMNVVPFGMDIKNILVDDFLVSNIIKDQGIDKKNLFIVSPDNGARGRAKAIAEMLGVDYGFFDKQRAHNLVRDGKNPIESHVFNGPKSLKGLDIVVIDDMIASGDSLISTAMKLKDLHAANIYMATTFSLFTSGISEFLKANEANTFKKLYTTNLSFVPEKIKQKSFIEVVDCAEVIAKNILTSF